MKLEHIETLARTFDPRSLKPKDRKLLVSLVVEYHDYHSGVVAFLIMKRK